MAEKIKVVTEKKMGPDDWEYADAKKRDAVPKVGVGKRLSQN
jgi:hypothetical protein